MKVQGAKAGSGSTRQAVIATDSAQSKSQIKYLTGLCEGEVEGLVDGLKSVYLDDTTILDSNGNNNFTDVTADFRPGTNDQTYIEGFPEVSNENEVNVELKTNPWIRSITNLDINATRVRLKWGALRTTNSSNGDVTGVTIQYAIDVSTDGGAYVEMLNTQISDKTSSNYERSHRIDLPQATSGWNIRVRRLTPPAASDYVTDQMYVASYAEVIDAKLRYPNTALLGVQYDAQNFSSVAKVSAEVKGLKIRVPSNYDPVNRTYVGIWDGSFKRVYSNNPAWIYFDLCTAKRYGLGDRITDQMLDKASLYRLGQYCDGMVSDGQGGLEPRFTCNVYIQSAEDAYSILSKLAGLFRAISYWDGDAIICDADIPQDVFFNYSNANVIEGHFDYSGTPGYNRRNVAKVAWSNPQNRYKTEYEIIRDEQAINQQKVIKIVDVDAWGCTSRGQAQRAGHWALKSEQLETQTVNFKVGLDGHIPVPGKVIAVADNNFAGRFIGGRIKAISDDLRVLTLDRDVVALAGDTIQTNSEHGQSVKAVIASINGAKVTVTQAFDQGVIAVQNVWTIDSTVLATRKFRVLSVKQDEEHQFSISALEYRSEKYDAIDNGAYVATSAPASIINPTTQAAVQNVQISSYDQVQQGINVATMIIAWEKADYAVKYLVEWKKDSGSWIKMPITGNTSVEIAGVYAGSYIARITAYSAFDIASLATTSALTAISGKQGKPPKLAFILATGTMFGMKLNWGFPSVGALDTAYTEIEYSSTSNGANSQSLGSYAYPTTSMQQQGLAGNVTLWYRARLIDRIGNTGDWSDWTSGTSTAQTADILDALSGQITDSQLDKNLKARIDKIDTIAGLDGDVGNIINKVNEVQQTADSALNKAQQEATDRAGAIQNVQSSIDQEAKDRVNAVQNVQTAVSKEVSDRIAAIGTVNDGITQEATARKNADTSIVNTVNTNKASTDKSIAAVQTSVDIVTTAQTATAKKLDGVYAKVTPITADSTLLTADSTSNEASSWTIQSAVADGDNALGQRIDVTQANVASNSALIKSEQT
ncbi:host specificity protein J, partial [Acinetobacter sp. B10A]|nr:host specificity protein J [Acinetobacter baretiae]